MNWNHVVITLCEIGIAILVIFLYGFVTWLCVYNIDGNSIKSLPIGYGLITVCMIFLFCLTLSGDVDNMPQA